MDVTGKKVTVVGMGRTSLALVRLLLREGAAPFVSDSAPAADLSGSIEELKALGVGYECGGHTAGAFADASLVIPSPGVPPGLEAIVGAGKAGAQIVGEMEFASTRCTSKIVAVTGTNGKTTTTELIRAMFEGAARSVSLAGNNAVPFSEAVLSSPQPEYLVLEVSSYQLETSRTFHPWIGVFLNVTQDHLARHSNLASYADVKSKLFANQSEGDVSILNYDDPLVRSAPVPSSVRRVYFSLDKCLDGEANDEPPGMWVNDESVMFGPDRFCDLRDLRVRGRHNLQNVLASLGAVQAAGLERPAVVDALRAFEGVEHRLEFVAAIDGAEYFNDSKSTNVESLRVALESFSDPCGLVLIAGGRGKGSDYSVLVPLVSSKVKHLILIGEESETLERVFGDRVPVQRADDLASAVRRASAVVGQGERVLLSPGCASFDMFDDFEHRGRVFKDAVLHLRKEAHTKCNA